jgi:hypothetical protein
MFGHLSFATWYQVSSSFTVQPDVSYYSKKIPENDLLLSLFTIVVLLYYCDDDSTLPGMSRKWVVYDGLIFLYFQAMLQQRPGTTGEVQRYTKIIMTPSRCSFSL